MDDDSLTTTSNWLLLESEKYIRKFQLSRTPEEREEAEKRLQEISARILIEKRMLRKTMCGE